MEFSSDYLTQQIIAYIGNKRKLLPLIYKAIQNTNLNLNSNLKFLDLFAGSGVVSRFAKTLGFEVFTNDWETYSYVINSCYIGTNRKEISKLFGSEENFQQLLDTINSLPEPKKSEQYIAKYYAPESFDIDKANYKTERLFYTRTNALAIDKIRNYIEENYPLNKQSSDKNIKIRNLLLAELIYECATHTNTSGVFKACHKGFGGHNGDALKRILSPIRLNFPKLCDSNQPTHIYQEDANKLVKSLKKLDIVYLDPPYNQHQYGSNYHLLNTIAKWDHIPAELNLNEKGELKEKAAIRHDWINTKSPYCYKQFASKHFEELISNIDAKYILISYSTDGIIPFDEMKNICMSKGNVSIVTNEYTTYRGGKQSNNRQNTNIEFILCIDTSKKSTKKTIELMDSILIQKKFLLLFKQKFNAQKIKDSCFNYDDSSVEFKISNHQIKLNTNNFFELLPPEKEYPIAVISKLNSILENCICNTKEEELAEIISKIGNDAEVNIKFIKILPSTLKKIAHKKNKDSFYFWLDEIKKIEIKHQELYALIKSKIEDIEKLAEIRFTS